MSELNLKNDLRDCLIDFNKRLLVSDLVEQYTLPYKEVHETLAEYISGEEKRGEKYEKRYLVHGQEKDDSKEVYTVVQGSKKLHSWLDKLKNAEHMLYSVEQVGGAKTPAQIFKPLQHCTIELKSLKVREGASQQVKIEKKPEPTKTVGGNLFAKKTPDEPSTSNNTFAGTDNSKQTKTLGKKTTSSPDEKKPEKQPSKKGIGNFFANSATKKEEKKDTKNSSVLKPPTPKKVNDFFKKQNEKPKASTPAKSIKDSKPTNTSVQLFEDDEEKQSSSSSDEEENLEILRRDIITSEIEESTSASTSHKRGRIVDSDEDDEEPVQKKPNKNDDDVIAVEDEKDDEVAQEAASETYMDDEGFLITVKSKKANSRKPAKVSPPEPKKANEAAAKSKLTAAAKTKTKQGSITSFFNKK